jgi:mannose-6-phosphate isomerase-like protein (cupin superfamily)
MAKRDFTKANLRDDVEDAAAANNVDGLEAHFAAAALGLKQSGISYQRIEPGRRQPWGHRHQVQEEVYVILAGSGIAKLGDEEVEVRPLDAIRVSPALARNFEAGPEGLDLLAYGSPRDPDDPGGEAEMLPGWWGDEDF